MATSTLGSGTLVLAGTTSGTTTVTATAVAGTTTLTLPAATDTLVGKATTDTLTNKTLTGAAMNGTLGATTPSTGAFTTISATTGAAVGGATPGAGGLAFPATAVAVADANTLDDYEEGTWTPTVIPGTGSLTAYTSSATYTKIGRVVTILMRITTTTVGTAGGSLNITNLPFSADLTIGHLTGYGREYNNVGYSLSVDLLTSTSLLFQKYDGTYVPLNGDIFAVAAVYFV